MGMNFQYDETGGTFYYFLVSFYALALIPFTFWVFRKKDHQGKWDLELKSLEVEVKLII